MEVASQLLWQLLLLISISSIDSSVTYTSTSSELFSCTLAERCFSCKCLVDDLEYFLSQALRLQRYTYMNKHSVQCYEQSCRLWCNILLLSKLLWCCVRLVDAQMVLHQTKPATIQAGLFSFQSINRFLPTIPIKREETVLPCMSLIGCSKFR